MTAFPDVVVAGAPFSFKKHAIIIEIIGESDKIFIFKFFKIIFTLFCSKKFKNCLRKFILKILEKCFKIGVFFYLYPKWSVSKSVL
jgi:hypothetical protein